MPFKVTVVEKDVAFMKIVSLPPQEETLSQKSVAVLGATGYLAGRNNTDRI